MFVRAYGGQRVERVEFNRRKPIVPLAENAVSLETSRVSRRLCYTMATM